MKSGAASMPRYPEIGLIALLPEAWGEHWTSRHQILMRLAQYFHVLWVNPAREWRTMITHPTWRPREVHVPGQRDTFTIYNPPACLPLVYRPEGIGTLLSRARLRGARARLERRGCTRIVVDLWHPRFAASLADV